jgi:hypothetical protein
VNYLQIQLSDQEYLNRADESPVTVSNDTVELLISFNSSPQVSLTETGLK